MPALSDKRVLGATVGDLAGGRWAISWIAYAANAPVTLLVIGSNAGMSGIRAPLSSWFLASVLGYIAFGFVFFAAHLTWFRHRVTNPQPLRNVVLLGGIAGGVRGATVGLLASLWGLTSTEPWLLIERIAIGVALGAVLVPLVAFMLGSITAYRTQRAALLDASRRLRALAMQEAGVSSELQAALLSSVRDDIEEVVRSRDPAVARQVSHRLWNETSQESPEPHMHWSAVLRASVKHNPFATLPVAGIWALSAVGTLTVSIGLPRALAQITYSVILITVAFALGQRLVVRWPRHSITVFVGILVLLIIVTGPVASQVFDPRPWPAGLALVVANTIWLPLLAIGIGFVSASLRASEHVLDDLVALVSEDQLAAIVAQDEHERLRRELASQLHGSVQSRLLAASAAPLDAETLSVWVDGLVAAPWSLRTSQSLDERLATILGQWSALMNITMEPWMLSTDHNDDAIVRLIEEAVANAFRHGRATHVRIAVLEESDNILVTVRDDGVGVEADVTPGIGSAVFTTVAPGAWELLTEDAGTILTARLPLRG